MYPEPLGHANFCKTMIKTHVCSIYLFIFISIRIQSVIPLIVLAFISSVKRSSGLPRWFDFVG